MQSITMSEKSTRVAEQQRAAEIERLIKKKEGIQKQNKLRDFIFPILFVLGFSLLTIAFISFKENDLFAIIVVYGFLIIGFSLGYRPKEDRRISIQQIDNKLDLLQGSKEVEERAEKLFRNNQLEVKRYYDSTLNHSRLIFSVGVSCILLGFAVIFFAMYHLILGNVLDKEPHTQIILAIITALGNVLTGFIGSIFLKMFTKISDSVSEFHNKLVITNNLFLANFFTSKISNEETREKLLRDISFEISMINSKRNEH